MNSNRNLGLVKFAVLALLIAAFAPQALRADDECSNSTLKGSYRVLRVGTRVGVGPIARVNKFVFDGSGNGQSIGFAAVNGVISTGTFIFTYTVNSDCTGTGTFPPVHANFVIDPNGDSFFFIHTDPGFVFSGQGIRLDKQDRDINDGDCSLSTLSGSYMASGGGTVVGVGPIAVVNNLYLDGSGNGQLTAGTSSLNGSVVSGFTSTVTYTVNADCTGTATFTPTGAPPSAAAHFNIVVDKKGAGFFFIQTDPGNVVTGQVIRLGKKSGDDGEEAIAGLARAGGGSESGSLPPGGPTLSRGSRPHRLNESPLAIPWRVALHPAERDRLRFASSTIIR